MMSNLDTIKQDIASLPLEVQQTIFELVNILKKRYVINQQEISENAEDDWSDFIGCMEAEPDLSINYKTYFHSHFHE
ncbi:MAG TPA: hypothetical protein V6C58_20090 [Allocoleopsis sp.]